LNRVPSLILFAAVASAPLPFGSTDAVTIAFWSIFLGIGAITASTQSLRNAHLAILSGIALIIAQYALVVHEQLSGNPWFAAPHPLWREASSLLATELTPSVSIARHQPLFSLGAPLVAVLSLVLGVVVGADRRRAHQLLRVIAWSGVVYAIYGIVSFLIDPTKLLWRDKLGHLSSLTAPFPNRNTAAVYFGACAVVWLLLLCEGIRRKLPRLPMRWTLIPTSVFSNSGRDLVQAFAMLLICLAAMFMTRSRAGVILSLMVLVVAFAVFFYRDLPRRSGLLIVVLVGGAIGLVLLQFLGAGVGGRFDAEGLADGGRAETYRATLRLIADYPWFGTGIGTFAWSYPAYRPPSLSIWGVWNRAHNTLLELAADVGIPLALQIAVAWIVALALLFKGARSRRRDNAIPAAALAVAMLALLHSLIDFSLQIPGFTLVVMALIGVGLAQSFASAPDRGAAP
jgi:O-antigen ligase